MDTIGQRVKFVRRRLGLSQENLAGQCNVKQQSIQHLELDRVKNPSYLVELADALGVDPRWLNNGDAELAPDMSRLGSAEGELIDPPDLTREPEAPYSELGDTVPVYGYVAGSNDMEATLNDGSIVEYSPRHTAQRGVRNAFKLYVIGDSMEPRYFANELVAVHPGRMPRKGEDCVLEFTNGSAMVKIFEGMDGEYIYASQYNPPKQVKFTKEQVKAVYAVVGRG